MKRLILLVATGLFIGLSVYSKAATTSSTVKSPNSNVHQINLRLKNQLILIQQGYKKGKFTKDQADSLRAAIRAVRSQEVSFFKQNGNHNLTADQQNQVNASLDRNSATLGEIPAKN